MDLCELLEEKVRHRKLCLSHSQNTLYHRSLKCLISQCSYINSQSTKVLLSKLPPKVIFDSCAMFRGYWWSEVTSKFKTSRRCRFIYITKMIVTRHKKNIKLFKHISTRDFKSKSEIIAIIYLFMNISMSSSILILYNDLTIYVYIFFVRFDNSQTFITVWDIYKDNIL